MYVMCTGHPPFRAESSYGVMRRITDDEARLIREINPEVPEWFCGIVERLMAKRPADRFTSASEVADLLEECLAHVQQPTSVPIPRSLIGSASFPTGNLFPRFAKRLAAVVAATLVMLAAVMIVLELRLAHHSHAQVLKETCLRPWETHVLFREWTT